MLHAVSKCNKVDEGDYLGFLLEGVFFCFFGVFFVCVVLGFLFFVSGFCGFWWFFWFCFGLVFFEVFWFF